MAPTKAYSNGAFSRSALRIPTTPTTPFGFQAPRVRMGSCGTASTDDSAADEMQRLADEAAYGSSDDDEDDEDDDDQGVHDDDMAIRSNSRQSGKQSHNNEVDIESIDIDIIFRHPAVRKLLDKLADQDKKSELMSEEDLRKHPYVSQLLAHVFDLSCRLTTLEQEMGIRDGKKAGKATSSSSTASRSAANKASSPSARNTASTSSAVVIQLRGKEGNPESFASHEQIPLLRRRFYCRRSAVKAFKPKTPSAPSVICDIYDDEPVTEERFAELKDAADDHVEDLHRLPDIPCALKYKTIGYYNTYYETELVEAINQLVQDHSELESKKNWKGRALIDYCLRGRRTRNPAHNPSPRSAAATADGSDSEQVEEEDLTTTNAMATNPAIRPPSSVRITDAQAGTSTPINATHAARRSYAPPDYSALGRALGREIPHIHDTSDAGNPIADELTAAAELSLTAQSTRANASPSPESGQTHTNDLSSSAGDPPTDAMGPQATGEQAATFPNIDFDGIDRDVGRYLCQARDATFNMKSTRPTVKKKLYSFSNSNPFSQAELDAAQARAATNESTSSPQKRKQRETAAGSPSKRQATATRSPLRAIVNAACGPGPSSQTESERPSEGERDQPNAQDGDE
ncbi:hypothetical protein OC844_003250 [Tilletia horrida]|nr:hypothetical protein OC844_003250 [Tilletia horrida]